MSRVVSMRFRDDQMERLTRLSRRLGRTPSETGALLIEEALRRAEFAFIDFRDSPVGRQAYVQGSSLAAWEVVLIAEEYGMDTVRTAEHFGWPATKVQAVLRYAAAYPEEIRHAIQDNDALDFMALSRMVPALQRFTVDEAAPVKSGQ